MRETYGVLRVVRVRLPANAAFGNSELTPTEWLAGERFVYVLTNRETTIGRALSNDILLMDPSVSREHARLIVDKQGWRVCNLTLRNMVRVNGQPVPAGESCPLQPQDFLVLGNTTLQLIAPQQQMDDEACLKDMQLASLHQDILTIAQTERQQKVTAEASGEKSAPRGMSPRSHEPHTLPPVENAWYLSQTPIDSDGNALLAATESESQAQWDEEEDESLLGGGVTMQFAFAGQSGRRRTGWLLGGIGLALLTMGAVVLLLFNTFFSVTMLQHSLSGTLLTIFIPLIPASLTVWLVNVIDRYEREPWSLRLAAFLWGGVIAIPLAQLIESWIDSLISGLSPQTSTLLRSVLQGLNPGVTEEALKGLGLLLLFLVLRDQFDNVTDGFVYGALIGAGFAMTENFIYFANYVSKDSLPYLFVGRIVLGWLTHPTFSICVGVALGYVRHTRVRWLHWVIPLGGFLVALILHSFYDFVTFYSKAAMTSLSATSIAVTIGWVAVVGNYILPLIVQLALLYILVKSLAHEATIVREFLASEVSSGVVRVDEYALLQSSFQRVRAERRILRKSGFKQWLRVKTLYQTEIGLAFRKWHVSMGDLPKRSAIQPEDVYRQRIQRLRRELEQAGIRK
ncbi:PrsW family glutamic-type intramembrane protease [Ktedonospora formicarum]|uniref:FHA domain-containing protein n=1 Tax=Ktedonospora formicarum TaxID=2778364 RepID=A0A8J3I4J1_9CHLR|nr:PrsW family glutamic-type intramembrane protease [Ktedonospora formicarum]GHO45289.1 hypothetical protein KSX_34520 [Ktedonospora formicarum]